MDPCDDVLLPNDLHGPGSMAEFAIGAWGRLYQSLYSGRSKELSGDRMNLGGGGGRQRWRKNDPDTTGSIGLRSGCPASKSSIEDGNRALLS